MHRFVSDERVPLRLIPRLLACALAVFLAQPGNCEKTEKSPDLQGPDLAAEIDHLLGVRQESLSSPESSLQVFARFDGVIRGLVQVEDFETALKLGEKCKELFPKEMRSLALLGWVQGLSGKIEESIETLRASLEGGGDLLPDPDGRYRTEAGTNLAAFLIEAGQYQKAVEHLETIREQNPQLGLPHYLAGLACQQIGDPLGCAKAYAAAFQADESMATSDDYLRYAWANDKLNRKKKSEEALGKAAARFPMTPGVHLNLGLSAEARNATVEAYCEYQMEILVSGEDSPYTERAHSRIDRIQERAGVSPFAEDLPLQVLRYLKFRAIIKDGQDKDGAIQEKADKLLQRIESNENLNYPYIKYLRLERVVERGQFDEAVVALEELVKKYPGQILFEMELAKAYAQIGESTKSSALLENALLTYPHHWKVREVLGPSPRTTEGDQ